LRIGVMTGGGDCQGLNAVIQAVVRRAAEYGYEVLGILGGYDGLLNGNVRPLTLDDVEGIFREGGTIVGTTRTNPLKAEDGPKRVLKTVKRLGIDAVVAIGGDDTLGAAVELVKVGVPMVGVPKTIDNDLWATDYCLGFQSAVEVAADIISRLHTTAKSHERVLVAEVMGRYAGWITLMAGLAGGAHVILLPEEDFDIDSVCGVVKRREAEGKRYAVIAVAEGAKPRNVEDLITVSKERDEYGHIRLGGIAQVLEKEIAQRTGRETRSMVLGHVQRGGPPGPFDIVLGIRLGLAAVDLIKQRKFGYMAALRGIEIVPVKMEEAATGKPRTVEGKLLDLTTFFSPI